MTLVPHDVQVLDVEFVNSVTAHDPVHPDNAELINGVSVPEQVTHLLDVVLRNSVEAQVETQELPKELITLEPQLTQLLEIEFKNSFVAQEEAHAVPAALITGVAPKQETQMFAGMFKNSLDKQEVTHFVPVESTNWPEGHEERH
jgi:hypothetical protein